MDYAADATTSSDLCTKMANYYIANGIAMFVVVANGVTFHLFTIKMGMSRAQAQIAMYMPVLCERSSHEEHTFSKTCR